MANIFSPFKYTIFDQVYPYNGKLPIIMITSDGEAYGTIEVALSLTDITTLTGKVWRLAAPTTVESRWSRLQPELRATYPLALYFTSEELATGYYKITWRFDPTALPISYNVNGNFFSVEFAINAADTAVTTQAAPKLIIKVENPIDFTGITGAGGITGYDSVYMGPTGAQGITGLVGAQGETGTIGIRGVRGYTGMRGIDGETGVQGPQGDTGSQGETGKGDLGDTGLVGPTGVQGETGGQGETGVKGETGLQGATGVQGDTGGQGVTGLMNFIVDEGTTGIALVTPALKWDLIAETLFLTATGLNDHYIQISSGSLGGSTGIQGLTGLPYGETGIPGPTGAQGFTGSQGETGVQGITGLIGETGSQGDTGAQGLTGLANLITSGIFPTGIQPAMLLWSIPQECWYGYVTGIGNWVQISSGSLQGIQGDTGVKGVTGLQYGGTGVINYILDGGGAPLFTGHAGTFSMPYNFQLDRWQMYSNETGSVATIVKRSSWDANQSGATAMHVGATGPYIANNWCNQATGLGGWACTTGMYGDTLRVEVLGVTGITLATLALFYHRT